MLKQIDQAWWFKVNGLTRRAIYAGAYAPLFKTVAVVEYPKSGGTWLSQMLSDATGLPYPRNRWPDFGPMILHGHYTARPGTSTTVVMHRDGRDIAVSEYFHWAFPKDITRRRISDRFRRQIGISDPHDIERHFPAFLEWFFAGGFTRFSWPRFVDAWQDRDAVATRYEALSACPVGEMARVLAALGYPTDKVETAVARNSFAARSGRRPGESDATSFMRKGITGDWRNVFTVETRQMFDHHAGGALIALGYERDRTWVRSGSASE